MLIQIAKGSTYGDVLRKLRKEVHKDVSHIQLVGGRLTKENSLSQYEVSRTRSWRTRLPCRIVGDMAKV